MKKTKILTRGITTALAVVSVFFVSHYAKAGENYIKTGEKVDFTELYDSKEFSTDNSKVTLSKDNKTDGLFVDGKTEEIENARFMLSKEIDFSDKNKNYYLIFGKESTGIPKEILHNNLDKCYRIPTSENIRALNLSNCVALITYEALRQQNFPNLLRSDPFKGEDYLKKEDGLNQ